jgi:hypothetical protein
VLLPCIVTTPVALTTYRWSEVRDHLAQTAEDATTQRQHGLSVHATRQPDTWKNYLSVEAIASWTTVAVSRHEFIEGWSQAIRPCARASLIA